MRTRIAVLIAAALVAATAGAALAARPEVAASWAEVLLGHDAAGNVTVDYYNDEMRHGLFGSFYTVDKVDGLRFANRCAAKGTSVGATIIVVHGRFHYSHDGVTLTGTFDGKVTKVRGTARVRTATCDSGILSFAAAGPGQP